MDIYDSSQKYAALFACLSPNNLTVLEASLSEKVVFIDPFNRVEGKQDFVAIFEHMFEVMRAPKFIIEDVAISPNAGYIKWQMTGELKSRPSFQINLVGMSELVFDENGLLVLHHDHWDSARQLLSNIPGAGFFIRKLLMLFALPKPN